MSDVPLSPHLPSPVELGHLLGLSQAGDLATDITGPGRSLLQISNEFRVTIRRLDEARSGEQMWAYKEEFNSIYMLSLFRSVAQQAPPNFMALYGLVVQWTALDVRSPVAARFVREHPKLVLEYRERAAENMCLSFQKIDRPLLTVNDFVRHACRVSISFAFRTLIELTYVICAFLPERHPVPALPPDSRAGIHALLDRYDSDPAPTASWSAVSQNESLAAVLASGYFMQLVDDGYPSDLGLSPLHPASREPGIVWRDCQVLADPHQSATSSVCASMKEGEQMMACGRGSRRSIRSAPNPLMIQPLTATCLTVMCPQCGAVRYCSKAHQKADWKRHKKFCFQPTW